MADTIPFTALEEIKLTHPGRGDFFLFLAMFSIFAIIIFLKIHEVVPHQGMGYTENIPTLAS